jgi:hypothetical protein
MASRHGRAPGRTRDSKGRVRESRPGDGGHSYQRCRQKDHNEVVCAPQLMITAEPPLTAIGEYSRTW